MKSRNAEKQARYRERIKAAGRQAVTVYVPPEAAELVRQYAKSLLK